MASLSAILQLGLQDNLTKPLRTVAMALKDADVQIKAVAKAMSGAGMGDKFIASLARLKLSKADIEAVATAWRDYAKSSALAADSSQWTASQIAGVRAWERANLSALRTVKAEQQAYYRSLKATAPPPGAMARAGGAIGGLLPFAGPAILAAVAKGVEGAAKLQGEDIANKVAGIPAGERAAANRQAIALSGKYGNISTAEVMQTYRELRSVLRDTAEVPGMMDVVVRAKSAMAASGLDEGGLVYALKAAEMLGKANSPAQMQAYLNAFVKAQQVEGKTITPEQLFEFAQQLKAAAPNLSADFVNTLGPLLAQEMQGGKAGTSVQQFEKQLQGGFQGNLHMAAKEFVALGLAKRSDFETTKTGEIKGMKRGRQVVGADLANTDPDKWVYKVLVPALRKAGFKTTEEMIKELPRLFPNTNAANLVAKFIQQQEQWQPKAERVAAGEGLDAANDQMNGVAVAFGALKKQIDDLGAVVDSPAMKDIGAGLKMLADGIGQAKLSVYDFAQHFPNAARAVADLGVAAGLAAGGFLSLKLFTGLTGGFGLRSSAVALGASAEALNLAAGRLGAGGVVPPVAAAGSGWLAALSAAFKLGGVMAIPAALVALDPADGSAAKIKQDSDRNWILDHLGGFGDWVRWLNGEGRYSEKTSLPYGRQLPTASGPMELHPNSPWTPTPAGGPGGWGPKTNEVTAGAQRAGAALDQLNTPVKPQVDTSSLDALLAKIDRARAGLSLLGALAVGADAAPAYSAPSHSASFSTRGPR